MATKKQIFANRRNAKKSTGPKSKKGKDSARRNALKNGLTASQLLTPDEDPEEYEGFRKDVLQELKPVGFSEKEWAEIIVTLYWRKRRFPRIEAGLLGGGKHLMERIRSTPIEEFEETVQTIDLHEDALLSELYFEEMKSRVDELAKPRQSWRIKNLPQDDLIEGYLRHQQKARQTNPLTYDMSRAFRYDALQQNALMKLAKYEAALDRQLERALREFRYLQERRKATAKERSR